MIKPVSLKNAYMSRESSVAKNAKREEAMQCMVTRVSLAAGDFLAY